MVALENAKHSKTRNVHNNSHFLNISCVSAPGKVLITGGYLVLDPKYSGLVLGTSSRFYTAISSTSEPSAHEEQTKINVSLHSPQFHYETRYTFICDAQTGISKLLLPDDSNYKRNPYIEYTLLYSLTVSVLSSPRGKHTDMKIRLVADNDFYSQRENVSSQHCVLIFLVKKFVFTSITRITTKTQKILCTQEQERYT
jgi:phosphomevalonate kinase